MLRRRERAHWFDDFWIDWCAVNVQVSRARVVYGTPAAAVVGAAGDDVQHGEPSILSLPGQRQLAEDIRRDHGAFRQHACSMHLPAPEKPHNC